jgi:hypothetical protein
MNYSKIRAFLENIISKKEIKNISNFDIFSPFEKDDFDFYIVLYLKNSNGVSIEELREFNTNVELGVKNKILNYLDKNVYVSSKVIEEICK